MRGAQRGTFAGGGRLGPGAGSARPTSGQLRGFLNLPGRSGGVASRGLAGRNSTGALARGSGGGLTGVAGRGSALRGGTGLGVRGTSVRALGSRFDRSARLTGANQLRQNFRSNFHGGQFGGKYPWHGGRYPWHGGKYPGHGGWYPGYGYGGYWGGYGGYGGYGGWYGGYGGYYPWAAFGIGVGYGALTSWIGAGAYPVIYDYGNTAIYDDGYVYCDGQPLGTAEQYALDAAQLADQEQNTSTDQAEWLPLGVFAIAPEGQTEATATLELAVSKEGVVRGNYYDILSENTQIIKGTVDKQTQQVAWRVGESQNVVMETGLVNLTENEVPVLVHFGNNRSQNWLMVRLVDDQEPTDKSKPDPPPPASTVKPGSAAKN